MSNIKKILVVEDEQAILKALEKKLDKLDFDVKTANNGGEALEILDKEEFDLILLDLIMPRLDGISTLKQIKAKGIKSKIIVVSNLGQKEDIDQVRKLGVTDYFIKAETTLAEIADKIKNI
jgi:DNA-binding response OmpR family regulator